MLRFSKEPCEVLGCALLRARDWSLKPSCPRNLIKPLNKASCYFLHSPPDSLMLLPQHSTAQAAPYRSLGEANLAVALGRADQKWGGRRCPGVQECTEVKHEVKGMGWGWETTRDCRTRCGVSSPGQHLLELPQNPLQMHGVGNMGREQSPSRCQQRCCPPPTPKKPKMRWVKGANQAPRGLVEEAWTPRSVPALGTNPMSQPLYRMLFPWPWRGDRAAMKPAHTMPPLCVFAAKKGPKKKRRRP